ncbi:hypothetical protein HYU21_00275 [Candidatus Woesearchaeota archaeon]|nr:hypothetical protein [Candidatus Woesearchaeota archaeon]
MAKKKRAQHQQKDISFLIVDDERYTGLYKDILERRFSNLQVRVGYSNEDVFEALNSGSYDVIFYDLGIGSDDYLKRDYSIVEKIRELKPGAVIIGTSAFIQYHYDLECLDQKCDVGILNNHGKLTNMLKEYGLNLIKTKRSR